MIEVALDRLQVNEAQLQYGSALAGSRYSYRPGMMPAAAHAPSMPVTPPFTGAPQPLEAPIRKSSAMLPPHQIDEESVAQAPAPARTSRRTATVVHSGMCLRCSVFSYLPSLLTATAGGCALSLQPATVYTSLVAAYHYCCRDEPALAGSSRRGDGDLLGGSYSNRSGKYSFGLSSLNTARYGKAADGVPPGGSASITPALRSLLRPNSPGRADPTDSAAEATTEPILDRVNSIAAADTSRLADTQQSSGATHTEAPAHPGSPDAELATPPISTRARRGPAGTARSSSPLASRPRFTTGSGRHTFDRTLAEDGL